LHISVLADLAACAHGRSEASGSLARGTGVTGAGTKAGDVAGIASFASALSSARIVSRLARGAVSSTLDGVFASIAINAYTGVVSVFTRLASVASRRSRVGSVTHRAFRTYS
jgi:hypothetical protein